MALERDILDDILDGKDTIEKIKLPQINRPNRNKKTSKKRRKVSFNEYIKRQANNDFAKENSNKNNAKKKLKRNTNDIKTKPKRNENHKKSNNTQIKKTRRFDV